MPISNPDCAAVSNFMAETYKVAMSHFSERIRTAESAELGGFDKQLSEKRKATIALAVSDIFTQAGAI